MRRLVKILITTLIVEKIEFENFYSGFFGILGQIQQETGERRIYRNLVWPDCGPTVKKHFFYNFFRQILGGPGLFELSSDDYQSQKLPVIQKKS